MNHKIHGEIVQEMHEQQGGCSRSRAAPCSESAEIVPENVSRRVDAMVAGETIIGGRNIGKKWAMKIATAKPANPINSIQNRY